MSDSRVKTPPSRRAGIRLRMPANQAAYASNPKLYRMLHDAASDFAGSWRGAQTPIGEAQDPG